MNISRYIKKIRFQPNISVILVIPFLGISLLFGLWFSVIMKSNAEKQVELNNIAKQNYNLVQAFEEHTNRTLEEVNQFALFVIEGYSKEGLKIDLPGLRKKAIVPKKIVSLVSLYDERGRLIDSDKPTLKSNIADREYFTIHLAQDRKQLYIGLPVRDRISNEWAIPMTRRINKSDGSFGGIIVAWVDPNYFSSFYKKINLGKDSLISWVGTDGIVRAQLPENNLTTGADVTKGTLFQALKSSSESHHFAESIVDKTRRILSYRTMQDYPFWVAVGISEEAAFNNFYKRQRTYYWDAGLISFTIIISMALLMLLVFRQQQERDFSRAIIDSLPGIFYLLNEDKKLSLWNKNLETVTEYGSSEIAHMSPFDLVTDRDKPLVEQHLQEIMTAGQARTEVTLLSRTRTETAYLLSGERIQLGGKNRIIGNGIDITIRKQAEEAMRQSESRFRNLAEMSSDWYWEQDENYRFTLMSSGIESSGFDSGSFIGKTRWEMRGSELLDTDWETHRQVLDSHQDFDELIIRRQDVHGNPIYTSVSGRPIFDEAQNFKGYRGIGCDITERKKSEERILYLAHYDELTCLPNRSTFSQRGAHALTQAQRYKKLLAVLFIDLDRFKVINDTLGHEIGDRLLKDLAQRLRNKLRAGDIVARQGGDEFIVLIEEYVKPQYVAEVARKVLLAVAEPFLIDGHELNITASIGISTYPNDGDDMPTLLKNADIALYRAKEEGKNIFQFYSVEMNANSYERLELESNLRHALERNEMLLHYQPKVDILTGRITGLEALLRWEHPKFGMVSPLKVIPLAEETGLIGVIGEWVLKTACAQNKVWQRAGLPPIRVAVNLSARQFSNENLLQQVADVLKETGLDPVFLELEITESMVMHNPEQAVRILKELQAMRIHVSIDDFGTGYSSLAYLKRFPIDTLKIDRSFIRDIPGDAEDVAIAQAIIAMAHSLRLRVIAEGVETEEQLSFLRANGCDEIQGYYFSKPLPENKIVNLLLKHARSNLATNDNGDPIEKA